MFLHPVIMLNTLSLLPSSTVAEIRHLGVSASWVELTPFGQGRSVIFTTVSLLKLLPSLQLRILRVFAGSSRPHESYMALNGLVQAGNSWKELQFYSPKSDMVGYKVPHLYTYKHID
jgi:hypothetical protein